MSLQWRRRDIDPDGGCAGADERSAFAAPASERQRLVDAGRATLAARYSKQAVVTAYLDVFPTLFATL